MNKQYLLSLALVAFSLGGTSSLSAAVSDSSNLQGEFKTQKVEIAKKILHKQEFYKPSSNSMANELVINRPGASFIKVHFEKLHLPNGAYIEVSNADGSELYQYGKDRRSPFTHNPEQGEDGRHSFSAMSISGDTAIVRLVGKNAKFNPAIHRAVMDSYMEGFSEQDIVDALNAPLQAKPANDFSIESTCGVNERRDVACWENTHPVEFERSRPVARILINGSSLCTAWRVGANNHMFTNEHCVNSQSGIQGTEVWFNYQRSSCGGNLGTTTKVTGATLLQSDFNLDYSLFTVNNFANIQSFGHFGLDVREAVNQEVIYIPQHGSGNPKELAIESDQNTGGLCRIDDVSATGRASNSDMGYFCDTIGGSSGSPVLARSTNNVIALHHFGGCTNQGVKIVNIWPQVSSFFGGNVPVGDNGGSGNASPNASFTHSCSLLSCSFDGSASSDSDGSVVSYSWNFGDGSNATGVSPNHNYASNGDYNVTLTVTDDEGASSSNTQTVSVNDGSVEVTMSLSKGKVKGRKHVDVSWSGATSGNVDIYRNGSVIATTTNDGSYRDSLGKVRGSFSYQVCEAGTSNCSTSQTISL